MEFLIVIFKSVLKILLGLFSSFRNSVYSKKSSLPYFL